MPDLFQSTVTFVSILLIGCTGEDKVSAAVPPPTDTAEDTGLIPEFTTASPDPDLSLEELQALIEEVQAIGMPAPDLILDHFLALMQLGDMGCPGSDTIIATDWCEASTGYSYEGTSTYASFEQTAPSGKYLTGTGFAGDLSIHYPLDLYPEDLSYRIGGGLTTQFTQDTEANATWDVEWRGSWSDPTMGEWLGAGISNLMYITASKTAGIPTWSTYGGLSVGDTDMFFEDFGWDLTGDCDIQPVGILRVRGSQSYWYELDFGDACSGCANVTFHDTDELGEICPDLGNWRSTAIAGIPKPPVAEEVAGDGMAQLVEAAP